MKPAALVLRVALLPLAVSVASAAVPSAAADRVDEAMLRPLDSRVLTAERDRGRDLSQMVSQDVRSRLQEANLRESQAWNAVTDRAEWEKFRDRRLSALRESLGETVSPAAEPKVLVTRRLEGEGYRVENLVFESRPGLVVTANLYAPARPGNAMPGILISHSHHNPKTQGEIQDMGMTWARQGCLVLIADHLGHGERRQHPFRSPADFPRPFRVDRQDYYFRYNTGVQLQVTGESLMGWMTWDLRRGLDVLLAQPGIDLERVILLGSVAGGGDPAAVTAALDARVQAVVPFNFGGTQPDYATPDDPERRFYFFGVADWESTRALRLGARDGFAQWLIVASVAPRRLILGHEFAWDPAADPAWPRVKRVFDWYHASDHLAVCTGQGTLRGTPPASSHCNNIGPLHRSRVTPILERWFAMPVPKEYSRRRSPDELVCLTTAAVERFRPRPLHELASEVGARRAGAARASLASRSPEERTRQLRADWSRLLGDVEPAEEPVVLESRAEPLGTLTVHRIALGVDGGSRTVVPVLLLVPASGPGSRRPVVIALAQQGKQAFLDHRSSAIAGWLQDGAAVCLVDVRGTGETAPKDSSRTYRGAMTSLSATEWLLGRTLLGERLRDLRSVLRHLRGRRELDPARVALWGDSFAAPNPRDLDPAVPLDADPFPKLAEPLGGLLALFGALFEDGVRAVAVRGGLADYASLLESPFLYLPHDALVPAALTAGDLSDVAAALAPRPLRLSGLVDGLNREVEAGARGDRLESVRRAYRARDGQSHLQIEGSDSEVDPAARWLLQQCLAN